MTDQADALKPVEIAERLWMVHPCRGVACCFDPEKVSLQVAQMIADEREACAKVADAYHTDSEFADFEGGLGVAADAIAAAIRARGQG